MQKYNDVSLFCIDFLLTELWTHFTLTWLRFHPPDMLTEKKPVTHLEMQDLYKKMQSTKRLSSVMEWRGLKSDLLQHSIPEYFGVHGFLSGSVQQ